MRTRRGDLHADQEQSPAQEIRRAIGQRQDLTRDLRRMEPFDGESRVARAGPLKSFSKG